MIRSENIYEQLLDYVAYGDTSFVTGDSPQDHDVNTDLGSNGIDGFIDNYGAGDMQYALSADGATFGNSITLPSGARDTLTGINGGGVGEGIDKIRAIWVADTKYSIRIRG